MDLDANHTLIKAIKRGDLDAMVQLVRDGVDVNALNRQGQSPLCIAALRGNTRVIGALLELGADPNRQNAIGFTPLTCAVSSRRKKAISYLRSKGARHEDTNLVVEQLKKRFPNVADWFPLWQND